jgi:hypothetical protein
MQVGLIMQRGQHYLLHRRPEVLDNEDGLFRAVNPEPQHCDNFDGNAISGNRFLLLNATTFQVCCCARRVMPRSNRRN